MQLATTGRASRRRARRSGVRASVLTALCAVLIGAFAPAGARAADPSDLVILPGVPIVEGPDGEIDPSGEIVQEFAQLSATPQDVELPTGLFAASASPIVVVFTDPTPADVQATVRWAVDSWAATLDLDPAIPLEVSFGWRELSSGLLGYAGPTRYIASGSLPPGYHPVGLANQLLQRDVLESEVDVVVVLNSAESWNTDHTRSPSSSQSDLASTVLHELGHGLGFVSSAAWRDGAFDTTDPILFSFDALLETGGQPLTGLSSSARRASLVSNNLWVDIGDGRAWPIWAPTQPSAGSSVGHFDELRVPSGQPGSMMTPMQQRGTTERVVDAPVLGVMARLGWPLLAPLNGPTSLDVTQRSTGSGSEVTVRWSVDDHRAAVPPEQFRVEAVAGDRVVASVTLGGSARSATLAYPNQSGSVTVRVTPLGYDRTGSAVSSSFPSSPSATASGVELDVDAQPLRDQVQRLYLAYFGRNADEGGLDHWMGRRAAGATIGEVSSAFAASPEFVSTYGSLGDGAFVDLVYRNVMGRNADAGGRAHWIAQLGAGLTRGDLMAAFSDSPEYLDRTGTSPVEPVHHSQVRRLYEAYFDRRPDAGGMGFWIGRIDDGATLAGVSATFATSTEFVERYGVLGDDAFVRLVYANVLDRSPDAGGLTHWRAQLAAGLARGDLMLAFSESPENIVRTGTLPS